MKTTNISHFKAHMSAMLRLVRDGDEIVILDRDIPVARVSPVVGEDSPLASTRPGGPIPFRKLTVRVRTDPVGHLLEDRRSR